MKFENDVSILMLVVLGILSFVFALTSVILHRRVLSMKRNCTSMTTGEVTYVFEKVHRDVPGDSYNRKSYIMRYRFKPLNMDPVELSSNITRMKPQPVGTKVAIFYNPNDPSEFVEESGGRLPIVIMRIFLAVAIIVFLIFIRVLFMAM